MRRILCFGDSNTYGYAPDGQRYEADSIWPGIMGKLLGDRFEVIADGKNGRTIAFDDPYMEGCNGMLDIEASLEANAPLDLVVLMLGTNDLKKYFDATPAQIAQNLKTMCELIQQKTDAKILIASPMLLGDEIEFSPTLSLEFGRAQIDYSFDFAPQFSKVAQEVGAGFIDLAVVAVSSGADCLHLMPEEHQQIGAAMKDKVMEAEKPVELIEEIIEYISKPYETLLDQYAGSGNFVIACYNKKRNGIAIEKNNEMFEKMKDNIESNLDVKFQEIDYEY